LKGILDHLRRCIDPDRQKHNTALTVWGIAFSPYECGKEFRYQICHRSEVSATPHQIEMLLFAVEHISIPMQKSDQKLIGNIDTESNFDQNLMLPLLETIVRQCRLKALGNYTTKAIDS